jgi:hypothetical protein
MMINNNNAHKIIGIGTDITHVYKCMNKYCDSNMAQNN